MALITFVGVMYDREEMNEKYRKEKKLRNEAIVKAEEFSSRLSISEAARIKVELDLERFKKCAQYSNPFNAYFNLQRVSSQIEADVKVSPKQLT